MNGAQMGERNCLSRRDAADESARLQGIRGSMIHR